MPLPDWRASLSVVDRYEAVQALRAALPPGDDRDAVAIEQAAYQASSSRAEYDTACSPRPPSAPPPPERAGPAGTPSGTPSASPSAPVLASPSGIRIGPYADCVPVAEGVTSTVLRCGEHALKVITAHRPLAPHNPRREAKILALLAACPRIVPLVDVFRDQEQRMVLRFPFMPLTLASLLASSSSALPTARLRSIFANLLAALAAVHAQGIIHRDVKPSAVLLTAPDSGPAYLSDFGTAWHPSLSVADEPAAAKVLDIGTGPYRAPEVLFGDASYGTPVDMWSLGVALAEAASPTACPPFESRPAFEDGSQLGLILSIFKTLGTPTPATWPEACRFKVSPFELWTVFPPRSWQDVLPGLDAETRAAVAAMLRFDAKRATAQQALALSLFAPQCRDGPGAV